VPHLVVEDFSSARRQDLQKTGKGCKTADIESILDSDGFLPERIGTNP
jgi:hypothetical protein